LFVLVWKKEKKSKKMIENKRKKERGEMMRERK